MTIHPQKPGSYRAGPLALIVTLLAISTPLVAQQAAESLPVERFALYVAANDGGKEREPLRYAISDAQRLARTLAEIGGVNPENSLILTEPSRGDLERAFASFSSRVRAGSRKAKRTEFLFYYSGHSDETSLLLGNTKMSYAELKSSLDLVPTDVHVVMLDSCHSGEFVRTKGGSRQKPFLMDDASVVTGHAYLSSSSATEASQESDAIKASYFTHSLVTGLRGAADASGDQKVSLNELYHYAFNDTLSKTEKSNFGPQHPSFNITLVGSGDLVLTDISEAESVLLFPADSAGKYFIRTADGTLVSEITKVPGTELALAIPAGTYLVTLVTPTLTSQASIALAKGQRLSLGGSSFAPVARSWGRARGGETIPQVTEETDWTPLLVSFVPGVEFPLDPSEDVNCSLGLLMSKDRHVRGFQLSGIIAAATGNVEGVQAAGFVNTIAGGFEGVQASGFIGVAGDYETRESEGVQASGFLGILFGDLKGAQASGYVNVATSEITGVQIAGFVNVSTGHIKGVQAAGLLNVANTIEGAQIGLINVAKRNDGYPIGLLNFIKDGVMDVAFYVDSNSFFWMQYQGGTNKFYTTFFIGGETEWSATHDSETVHMGYGVGVRIPVSKRMSVDIELLHRTVMDLTDANPYMEKLKNGEEIVIETNAEAEDFFEKTFVSQIPSLRGTLNVALFRYLTVFGSITADVMVPGFNERAFTLGSYGPAIDVGNTFSIYPSVAFGIKF